MNPRHPICPSILSTSFFDLSDKLTALTAAGVDFLHLDVMDGHFVTNLSFGPSLWTAIKQRFSFRADAHLMVTEPERIIPWFIAAGAEAISFHLEAAADVEAAIRQIREAGRSAGLALNPDTPIERAVPFLPQLDYLLLMSVFPGRGGQPFIPATLERLRAARLAIDACGSACRLQVDGGINADTIAAAHAAGARLFVVGTYLYNSPDIPDTLRRLCAAIA